VDDAKAAVCAVRENAREEALSTLGSSARRPAAMIRFWIAQPSLASSCTHTIVRGGFMTSRRSTDPFSGAAGEPT